MSVAEVKRILTLDLSALVDLADQVVLDPRQAPAGMTEGDVALLTGVGLPLIDEGGFVPGLDEPSTGQQHAGPELHPLGFIEDYEVGLDCRSGAVWATSKDPNETLFVNSSLQHYVDASWRWYRIRRLVEDRQSISEDMYDMVDLFYDQVKQADSRVEDERMSLWRMVKDAW